MAKNMPPVMGWRVTARNRAFAAFMVAASSVLLTAAGCVDDGVRTARQADELASHADDALRGSRGTAGLLDEAETAAADQIARLKKGDSIQQAVADAACDVLGDLEDSDGRSDRFERRIYDAAPELRGNAYAEPVVESVAEKLALVSRGGAYLQVRVRACGW